MHSFIVSQLKWERLTFPNPTPTHPLYYSPGHYDPNSISNSSHQLKGNYILMSWEVANSPTGLGQVNIQPVPIFKTHTHIAYMYAVHVWHY
jgi:hypothetical protein